jgi:hypothetical protein
MVVNNHPDGPDPEATPRLAYGSSERGHAIPSGSVAAGALTNSDAAEELDDGPDDYDELLGTLGRTLEHDHRIAVHEAGHAVAARLLGHSVGGATVNPDPDGGYEGLCWGVGHKEAFAEGRGDATDVRTGLAPLMPEPGEDRRPFYDIFGHVRDQCIEFLAGRAAERMLLDGESAVPADDLRQARELASLMCSSEEAVETFIAHCDTAARDLLLPYGDVVIALATALRIKRTLDGAEIDALISNVEMLKAQAIERCRRADWRKRELSARNFLAEQDHTGDAPLPYTAHDPVTRLRG